MFTEVAAARASVGSLQVTPEVLDDPEALAKFQAAQSQMGSALSRLLAVSEAYPDLKASTLFQDLNASIEGTENRINVARDRYNEQVNIYDIYTSKFPNKILAGWFGFEEMARYQANPGSENAPDVNFEFN